MHFQEFCGVSETEKGGFFLMKNHSAVEASLYAIPENALADPILKKVYAEMPPASSREPIRLPLDRVTRLRIVTKYRRRKMRRC
jgi:hypothetical protein